MTQPGATGAGPETVMGTRMGMGGGLETAAGGESPRSPRSAARRAALRRWTVALGETAAIAAAFLAVGLGYAAWISRARAEPAGYVAARTAAPEDPPAHVAAWSGGHAAFTGAAARP